MTTEELVFILVAFLLLIILLVVCVLAYLGHRFLKLKELEKKTDQNLSSKNSVSVLNNKMKPELSTKLSPELLEALRSNAPVSFDTSFDTSRLINQTIAQNLASVCIDHPDAPALKKCSLSDQSYCESCITRQLDVWVAKKYLDVLLDSEWEELFMLPDTKSHHDVKVRLKKVKAELWEKRGIPVLVQGHYKINVEEDEIESYTVIKARAQDLEFIKKELSFLDRI